MTSATKKLLTSTAVLALATLPVLVMTPSASSDTDGYLTDVHYKYTVTFEIPGVSGCDRYVIDYGDGCAVDSDDGESEYVSSVYVPDTDTTTFTAVHTYPLHPATYTMTFTAYNESGDTAVSGLNVCLMGYPVISFESNDGSVVDDVVVPNGPENGCTADTRYFAAASEPDEPVREGMTFTGWYSDEDCTIIYDWSSSVTESVTLYAGWKEAEPAKCVITFYVDRVPYYQTEYSPGDVISAPPDPVKEGYTFVGWKNFSTGLTATETRGFCAQFASAASTAYKVSYVVGDVMRSLYVTPGVEPVIEEPVLEGFEFQGWYIDEPCTIPFEASKITSDTRIYAKFTQTSSSSDDVPIASIAVMALGVLTVAAGFRYHRALIVIGAALAVAGGADATGLINVVPRLP